LIPCLIWVLRVILLFCDFLVYLYPPPFCQMMFLSVQCCDFSCCWMNECCLLWNRCLIWVQWVDSFVSPCSITRSNILIAFKVSTDVCSSLLAVSFSCWHYLVGILV
jgi:hypothetical protein